MAEYCNSKELERIWFNWLISTATPHLDYYREQGLLWTKVIGKVHDKESGKEVGLNPLHPVREHCIALGTPFYFTTDSTKPTLPTATITLDGKTIHRALPTQAEMTLLSNSRIHSLSNPYAQARNVIPGLTRNGFIKEIPPKKAWDRMLCDISRICSGISKRFKLPSEEDQEELASDALLQVTNKLVARTLVYTPGRAPVFNLLTTTIYRCIFSILNKQTKYRHNVAKLAADLQSGTILTNNRSLRVPAMTGRTSIIT